MHLWYHVCHTSVFSLNPLIVLLNVQHERYMTVTEFFPASPRPHPVVLGGLLVLYHLVGEAVCQVEDPEVLSHETDPAPHVGVLWCVS